MKTESSAAMPLPSSILRVVYQGAFNEEQIRVPLAKVQKMKPLYGWEYRTTEAVAQTANWDEAWFAHYE